MQWQPLSEYSSGKWLRQDTRSNSAYLGVTVDGVLPRICSLLAFLSFTMHLDGGLFGSQSLVLCLCLFELGGLLGVEFLQAQCGSFAMVIVGLEALLRMSIFKSPVWHCFSSWIQNKEFPKRIGKTS